MSFGLSSPAQSRVGLAPEARIAIGVEEFDLLPRICDARRHLAIGPSAQEAGPGQGVCGSGADDVLEAAANERMGVEDVSASASARSSRRLIAFQEPKIDEQLEISRSIQPAGRSENGTYFGAFQPSFT